MRLCLELQLVKEGVIMLFKMYKSNTSINPWGCPKFLWAKLLGFEIALTQWLFQVCAERHERDIAFGFLRTFRLSYTQWNILYYIQKSLFEDNMVSCCRMVVPCTQGGAVQVGEAQFHLARHWYHVVPLSWMALISALSWSRLILTVLTLSPVLHCDTGHRRNSPHPHFSKLKHHL